jgi:hypothetical protein
MAHKIALLFIRGALFAIGKILFFYNVPDFGGKKSVFIVAD